MVRLVLLSILLAQPARAAKSVECTDKDTDEKYEVVINQVKRSPRTLEAQLKKLEVHMLDLPEDAQEHSRGLQKELTAQDWCAAGRHMRNLEDAIAAVRVHAEFVNQKFSRIERWVRAGKWDERTRKPAERNLANAAAQLSTGELKKANKLLNQVIATLFHIKGYWDLPDALPDISAVIESGAQAKINEEDVARGCPKLAKKGRGGGADLKMVRKKLRKAMNEGKIRVGDIKGGDGIISDLKSYIELRANWPAIRAACALLAKVDATEVNLGLIMGRFHRINKIRRSQDIDEDTDSMFRDLVRGASDAIAKTDYDTAHARLEEALILLGASASPYDSTK